MPILTYPTVRQASIFVMFSQQSRKPDHWRAAGKIALRPLTVSVYVGLRHEASEADMLPDMLVPQIIDTYFPNESSMFGSLAEIKKISIHVKIL